VLELGRGDGGVDYCSWDGGGWACDVFDVGEGEGFGELWDGCVWSECCYEWGCVEVDTDVMGEVQKSRERLWMLLGFL